MECLSWRELHSQKPVVLNFLRDFLCDFALQGTPDTKLLDLVAELVLEGPLLALPPLPAVMKQRIVRALVSLRSDDPSDQGRGPAPFFQPWASSSAARLALNRCLERTLARDSEGAVALVDALEDDFLSQLQVAPEKSVFLEQASAFMQRNFSFSEPISELEALAATRVVLAEFIGLISNKDQPPPRALTARATALLDHPRWAASLRFFFLKSFFARLGRSAFAQRIADPVGLIPST